MWPKRIISCNRCPAMYLSHACYVSSKNSPVYCFDKQICFILSWWIIHTYIYRLRPPYECSLWCKNSFIFKYAVPTDHDQDDQHRAHWMSSWMSSISVPALSLKHNLVATIIIELLSKGKCTSPYGSCNKLCVDTCPCACAFVCEHIPLAVSVLYAGMTVSMRAYFSMFVFSRACVFM